MKYRYKAMHYGVALSLLLFFSQLSWAKDLFLIGRVTQQVRISQSLNRDNQLHLNVQSNMSDGMTVEVKDRRQNAAVFSQSLASENPNQIAQLDIPTLRPGVYMVILRRL